MSGNAVCCHHNGEAVDKRGRGGLIQTPEGGVSYHCFNCGFKASYQPGRHLTYKFRKLLSWFGADENTIRHLVIEALRIRELVQPDLIVEHVADEPKEFEVFPLPDEAKTLHELSTFYTLGNDIGAPRELNDAVLYAASRKVDFGKYDFYWTPETESNLQHRLIIPFTWKNKIVGYTARALNDSIQPKYHTSCDSNFVFNIDKQLPSSKFVIISEGPFDAMAIDGVGVLTNDCNEEQADIIESLGKENIVVPHTDKAGRQLLEKAMEYGWTVSFPVWLHDYKDISAAVAELGKLFVLKSILAARESGKLKIELLSRRLYN